MTADGGPWSALLAERKAQWDALRARGPVVEIGGAYHLTRKADVVAAVHDTEVFSSALRAERKSRMSGFELVNLPLIPTLLDPPEHTPYREALRTMFSPRVVEDFVPELTAQAAGWVERVAVAGECDVIEDVVLPYGVMAWQSFLGLPAEDGFRLFDWRYESQQLPDESIEHLSAVFQLFAYMSTAVAQRRRIPGMPGLLAKVTDAFSERDAVAAAYTMYGAGGANEIIALGYALLALAGDPQLRRVLCADPEQTKVFVDEVLRLETPLAAGIERVTTRDVTIADVTIPAGADVRLLVGTINRESGSDDIVVADGQVKRCPHWTFAAGPHRCPAAGLVRVEMTVLINEWLARIPEFQVAPGYRLPDIIERSSTLLPSLPLRWDTADTDMFSMAYRSFTRAGS